ncbi:DNA repair-scaffolding protein isoform X1 [Erinaceus europaeus]|uniref:DNA repair-scaffolding protein isoform X1 n=2 Tax=Erinaceus europaeus TaxID=9365 RepID=A0A1S3WIW8_ERIEU|nr:DNA repair-scaffolding protein isoform X1 [Erinaceus europaeus]
MERVKSMETTLYTPQKQTKFSRTPEKAKKKLLRGGLAERMSGLQNRERSAISLWRHQCASYQQTLSGRKSGMLIVKILELQEECSLQVAMCEQLEGPQAHNPCQGEAPSMKVLFTKETAGHLKAHLQDIIHIYPPWQKLIIPNQSCPIILNTYFCKKVAAKELSKPVQEVHYWDTLLPRRSITLAQMFRLKSPTWKPPQSQAVCGALASMGKDWAPEHQEAKQHSSTRISLRDSLLDAVESQGAASWSTVGVRVVVQRVYCLPVRRQQGAGPTALPSSDAPRTRVCLLVQDAYGMFSEVHTEGTIWNNQQLEGRSCSLTGVKVLQKATRGRTAGLFSLIDSLWPPAEPLRAPGPYLVCGEENTHLPPPSFCYILTTHPDLGRIDVTEDPISKFYQPPVTRSLRDVLQTVHPGTRCCFYAQVIYQRPQLSSLLLLEQREIWLTVTDVTLQTQGEDDAGLPHTMLVCVTSGCMLAPDVQEALTEAAPHNFLFRDALRDQGWLVCAERTVLLLQKPLLGMDTQTGSYELTGSPRLDELGPNTQVNSICSVQGTVVGVDESTAFSWPTCNLCGNGRLEQNPEDRGALSCRDCSCVVTSPLLRRHLQVFLHCPLCPQSTVKVKLLQASISSLLRSAACEDGTYEVQSILGKEVGLRHCFLQSIATHPAHCITLEEIELLKAGRASVESHRLPRDP